MIRLSTFLRGVICQQRSDDQGFKLHSMTPLLFEQTLRTGQKAFEFEYTNIMDLLRFLRI